jgi:alpha-D-ribose 1-methylphosphonate 5-triphosphate synthase subunit PhnH
MTPTATLRRIDGATSQGVFDTLLRTLAEPGRILRFGDEVLDMPAVALGPLALADVDVTVAVLGDGADLAGDISRTTGARIVAAGDADLVVADPAHLGRSVAAADLDGLAIGSPLAPEDACRLFIAVEAIHGIDPGDADTVAAPSWATRARLSGPGIAGHRQIGIDGLAVEVLAHLGRASGTFPTGIDTWLVAPDGAVVGLPRSTTVELATPTGTDSPTATDSPTETDQEA